MLTDLELAIGHHIFVFTLVAIIAVEFALLRPGVSGKALADVARLDAAYGGCAILVVAIGVARVAYGAKAAEYYLSDPWFWCKMVAFAGIAGLSIVPTISLLRWQRASRIDSGFVPPAATLARTRRLIAAELALVPVVLGCAAAMARFGGL
jgi:putative membrane protein